MPNDLTVGGLHFMFDDKVNIVDYSDGHPDNKDGKFIWCRRLNKFVVRLLPEQYRTLKTVWRMREAGEFINYDYVTWLQFRQDMWWSSSRVGHVVIPHARSLIYVGPKGEVAKWDDSSVVPDYIQDVVSGTREANTP